MTTTLLQRIHSIADKPQNAEVCKAVATIARKLASDDDAVSKAHAIAGALKGFGPIAQVAIITAVEALQVPAAKD